MNKQRLMELAGIASNMNNPSQEPYTEIPSSDEEPSAMSDVGDEQPDILEQVREIAERGMEGEDAREALTQILHLLSGEENGGEEEERF